MAHPILVFLQSIPQHKITTYKHIAQKFATHPRAIARILASNTQQDIYPCYKVICSDGTLGGYNLGIQEKIRRLQADNIAIVNNKIPAHYIRNSLDNTR